MGLANARMACFELWGGNCTEDHAVELPGLAGWVYSAPLDPASGGGDVHYFSVCNRGSLSRIAVADIAGHGPLASATAKSFCTVLQRFTNSWDQTQLMQELNDGFMRESLERSYATAVVLGFVAETGQLVFSSAGHPPPLWYRAGDESWHLLEDCTPFTVDIEGLPLGVIAGTTYSQTGVRLGVGDVLVIYTDGITEGMSSTRTALGQAGLLQLARSLPASEPLQAVRSLISGVQAFREGIRRHDDDTMVVLRRIGGG
jgi:phosphoserine phosphatase RsbU/P